MSLVGILVAPTIGGVLLALLLALRRQGTSTTRMLGQVISGGAIGGIVTAMLFALSPDATFVGVVPASAGAGALAGLFAGAVAVALRRRVRTTRKVDAVPPAV